MFRLTTPGIQQITKYLPPIAKEGDVILEQNAFGLNVQYRVIDNHLIGTLNGSEFDNAQIFPNDDIQKLAERRFHYFVEQGIYFLFTEHPKLLKKVEPVSKRNEIQRKIKAIYG